MYTRDISVLRVSICAMQNKHTSPILHTRAYIEFASFILLSIICRVEIYKTSYLDNVKLFKKNKLLKIL